MKIQTEAIDFIPIHTPLATKLLSICGQIVHSTTRFARFRIASLNQGRTICGFCGEFKDSPHKKDCALRIIKELQKSGIGSVSLQKQWKNESVCVSKLIDINNIIRLCESVIARYGSNLDAARYELKYGYSIYMLHNTYLVHKGNISNSTGNQPCTWCNVIPDLFDVSAQTLQHHPNCV